MGLILVARRHVFFYRSVAYGKAAVRDCGSPVARTRLSNDYTKRTASNDELAIIESSTETRMTSMSMSCR